MTVESEVVQTLNPFQVTEVLSRLTGHPVPVAALPARQQLRGPRDSCKLPVWQ